MSDQQPLSSVQPDIPGTVKLENVQGDVIFGLSKFFEHFVFLTIKDADQFKQKLPVLSFANSTQVHTAKSDCQSVKKESSGRPKLLEIRFINIAFSKRGLEALGIEDTLKDPGFSLGQLDDAANLGDGVRDGKEIKLNWDPGFLKRIDLVLLAAAESDEGAEASAKYALDTLGESVVEVHRVKGRTRGDNDEHKDLRGHEHFGWLDGISNPVVKGLKYWKSKPQPEREFVDPGVILVGHTGDPIKDRPEWAFEGSFMVFRQLEQRVPELNKFLKNNPYILPNGLPAENGSELQGARFMGRWKNGIPIELSPTSGKDAKDPTNLNDFDYPAATGDPGQTNCPYSAHLRKMRPRTDLPQDRQAPTRINRQGIPYGEDVTEREEKEEKTLQQRGLAFVCYQSDMNENGFRHIQKKWANDVKFLADTKKMPEMGFDPIIGQASGDTRTTEATEHSRGKDLFEEFVISRGGEYFFAPSIRALQTVFVGKPY